MLKQEIRPSEKNIPRRNGDYIIDYCEIYDYSIDEENNSVSIFAIVIGHNPKATVSPFVTWEYAMHIKDCEKRESFFWGHYFSNEYNARVDYHERLSNYYRLHTASFEGED